MNVSRSLALFVVFASFSLCSAEDDRSDRPTPQPIELSGKLIRPIKWTPQLELFPSGQIRRFDIQGDLLRDIKEGTFLHVKGVVRSRLHPGSTKDNLSPFGAQWTIWLEVTDVRILDDPYELLKEIRGPVNPKGIQQ